jgi:hypothetical protein
MRKLIRGAVPMVVVAVGGLGAPAAEAKTSVAFALPASGTAATPTPFTYSARGLRGGDRLVLQRQQGSAGHWRTAVKLVATTSAGRGKLPALPLGAYTTRVAVLTKAGRVRAQQTRRIKVYGQVPYSTLFGTAGGVYTTPTATFRWVFADYAAAITGPIVAVTTNPCRSTHVDFVPGNRDAADPNLSATHTGTVTVVQESRDPVSATVPAQANGSLDATLVPGQAWSLKGNQTGNILLTFYVNGTASCFSAGPLS